MAREYFSLSNVMTVGKEVGCDDFNDDDEEEDEGEVEGDEGSVTLTNEAS